MFKPATFLALLMFSLMAHGQDRLLDTHKADGLVDSCKAMVNANYDRPIYATHATTAVSIGMLVTYCDGYLSGFISGSSMVKPRGGKPLFCLPSGLTTEQAAKVLIKALDDAPQLSSTATLPFVAGVFAGVWPCN